jgi:hypothetical protein
VDCGLAQLIVVGFPKLKATIFEFYTMGPSVPDTTPVTIEKLPILMEGPTKIADAQGSRSRSSFVPTPDVRLPLRPLRAMHDFSVALDSPIVSPCACEI